MDPLAALAEASPVPFWLDRPERPAALPALAGEVVCDLAIVGGGFAGLWAALIAAERDPGRSIVLLEADRVADHATGRNGGFCDASLTHGFGNGVRRFADEFEALERLGAANLAAIAETVGTHAIDCAFEQPGTVELATTDHQVATLRELHALYAAHDYRPEFLDGPELRTRIASPTYLAGIRHTGGNALVDPARLAWGLAAAAQQRGVTIYERTRALALREEGGGVAIETAYGAVHAHRAVLATNVFPALVRRLRPYVVPVYDHVLVTEPLPVDVRRAIGWDGREGLADSGNQFHYYRLTADDRILFGGYEATYRFGGRVEPDYRDPRISALLVHHLRSTFPQLEDVRITHAWAGVIDTCSRFCPFFDLSHGGRVASTLGFTGLGVGASRFAAWVALDLVDGRESEATGLDYVRSKPLPFPPEPLRAAAIALTRRSLQAEDRSGRRNIWLRAMDRLGVGYDS